MRKAVCVAVIVAAMLSGCSGKATPTPLSTSAPPADAETGTLSGLVTDDERAPLGGADVWMEAGGRLEAITDGGGRFTLRGIPPGTHTVTVEAKGFVSASQRLAFQGGVTTEATFLLESVPTPVARTRSYVADAIIEFEVNVLGVRHYDNRSGTTYRDVFYDVTPDVESAVVGLQWTATSPVSAKWLFLGLYLADRQCVRVCDDISSRTGRSPLVTRGDDLDVRYADRGGDLTVNAYFDVRPPCTFATLTSCPDNPDAVAQFAVDQRLKLYTTVFFVEPAPAGYNPLPP